MSKIIDEKNDEKSEGGRPAIYDDNHHPWRLYAMFWDNSAIKIDDVAKEFGIHRETINDWINKHSRFSEAYKKCRSGLKGQLIYSALKEALGYTVSEKTTSERGTIEAEKWMRPQAGILKLLLSNFGIKELQDAIKIEQVTKSDVLKELFESAKNKVSSEEYTLLLTLLSKVANE